jgi:hypothetical protein
MKTVIGICLFLFTALPVRAQYDAHGGWVELQGKKTGFFHTEQIEGVGWRVTPDGNVGQPAALCRLPWV